MLPRYFDFRFFFPVMDLRSGVSVVITISTHQTILRTDKLPSPTVAVLNVNARISAQLQISAPLRISAPPKA